MRKRLPEIQEDSAQDSFLDVIANLVGVIIILVMLVGAKATRDVLRDSKPEVDKVAVSEPTSASKSGVEIVADKKVVKLLTKAKVSALRARQEVEEIAVRLVRMKQESTELDAERVTLAMHRSIVEEDIAKRRARLDADKQKEFDVQRQIVESQIQLDKLMQEQLGLLDGPQTVEELECLPTPIGREEDGSKAINIRLKNGLASILPVEELLAELENHGHEISRRLETNDQVVDRLRFVIGRFDDPASINGPRAGHVNRPTIDFAFEFLPTSEDIGQDVELAMAPGGSLNRYLTSGKRQSSAVIIWLYPDSYDDFRFLKRELWKMGYAVAVKALDFGHSPAGARHGGKTMFQ
jgi:hypothetical protein